MTVELLREAAAKMRERAEATTPGPWAQGMIGDRLINEVDCLPSFGFVTVHPRLSDDRNEGVDTAEHIASWHPLIALAVADWLDLTAEQMPKLGSLFERSPQVTQALTVARAYLAAPVHGSPDHGGNDD